MKVILTEKVASLGNVGEVVNVSAGHARNFLIPNNKAVLADDSNKAQMNHYNKMLAKKVSEEKSAAEAVAKQLNGLNLDLIKKVGSNGRLFGTVTTTELSKILADKGIEVEKRVLSVDNPIKAVGSYTVKAKLFNGVEAEFGVKVEMDPKQAEELKKKAEAAAKKKAAKAEADAAAKEAGETAEGEEAKENQPLTDEQKLAKEADELLRS
ncbi:MAG: 50S ribosomal protein L9 [Bdellovibrionota bacterium]|jgi:large subunit ribosomal protein L9|nr:50S ribosomal protein L9 [Bdellovibrionota bacterium]